MEKVQKYFDGKQSIVVDLQTSHLESGLSKVSAKIKTLDGQWQSFSAKISKSGDFFDKAFKGITNTSGLEKKLERLNNLQPDNIRDRINKLNSKIGNYLSQEGKFVGASQYQKVLPELAKVKSTLVDINNEMGKTGDNVDFSKISNQLGVREEYVVKLRTGTWVKYPGSSATTQLTVKPTDAVFTNDIAIIKCLTTDGSIFDIHQINKLRDGAAGSSTYTAVLSNESQLIPCNPDGTIYEGALNGVTTTITIYEGATNDTQNWTISHVANGITGTYNEKTFTYTVTGMSGQTGSVIFTCSKDGAANIVKKFNLTKLKSGADGQDAVYYDLSSNNTVLKLDINKNFVPSSIIFSSTKRIGDTLSPSAYAGRYKIYESTDGTSFTLKYTSGSDESSKTYPQSANTVQIIKCE